VTQLEEIFKLQEELATLLGMKVRVGDEDVDLYAGDVLVACMGMASESGEVLSEVNVLTRPWARKTTVEARKALAEEAVDVFFFFVELMILLGLGPDDVLKIYREKWERNIKRFSAAITSSTVGNS
jgi:NTP pyrophosphatase (non-canonical NTP hydrolase)